MSHADTMPMNSPQEDPGEARLLMALRQGDERAYEDLVRAHT